MNIGNSSPLMLGNVITGWISDVDKVTASKTRVELKDGRFQRIEAVSNRPEMYVVTDDGKAHHITVSTVLLELERGKIKNADGQDFKNLSQVKRMVIFSMSAQSLDLNKSGKLLYTKKTVTAVLTAAQNYVRALLAHLTAYIHACNPDQLLPSFLKLAREGFHNSWFEKIY